MNLIKTFLTALTLLLASNIAYAGSDDCPQINTYGKPESTIKYFDICRTGYSIGYNLKTKTPAWVAERLTRQALDGKTVQRTDNFRPDPLVPSQYSATLADYKGSGFDRGHMAPAEDFRNSKTEMSDSFYLSNMIPQNANLNRGAWAVLEKNMRYWAQKYNEIYVITGPLYYENKALGYAGTVPVPTHVFKAVYIPQLQQSIAFILPNQAVDSDQIPNSVSTVKNLELLTGIKFFPKLNISETEKSGIADNLRIFNK